MSSAFRWLGEPGPDRAMTGAVTVVTGAVTAVTCVVPSGPAVADAVTAMTGADISRLPLSPPGLLVLIA